MDFAALISRNSDRRPARVAQIVPRECYRPSSIDGSNFNKLESSIGSSKRSIVFYQIEEDEEEADNKEENNGDVVYMTVINKEEGGDNNSEWIDGGDDLDDLLAGRAKQVIKGDVDLAHGSFKNFLPHIAHIEEAHEEVEDDIKIDLNEFSMGHAMNASNPFGSERQRKEDAESQRRDAKRALLAEELAFGLAGQTFDYKRHQIGNNSTSDETALAIALLPRQGAGEPAPVDYFGKRGGAQTGLRRALLERQRKRQEARLHPSLHEVELGDWESKINWLGASTTTTENADTSALQSSSSSKRSTLDPTDLLSRPYEPTLDAMDFSSAISWGGADAPPGFNHNIAKNFPLILQEFVAGRSVAKLSAPQQRPNPFFLSDEYDRRQEQEMATVAASPSGMGSLGNSLNKDNEKLEAIIRARQEKRAQMAKDKSTRVTEAMGTLDMGGGKGRTITSSLMGPGGTERTGRPSRHGGSSLAHDAQYIEQLELVYNHTLVKPDLRKSELRQFRRPRIPRAVVRMDRPWQFQIRVFPFKINKGQKSHPEADGSTVVGSYQAMMGATSGSAKIRNEADLSPSEGDLVIFEYCEERPPVQMSKGMACRIVNYYRGDKARCPISAGGGDRPTRKRSHGDKSKNGGTAGSAAATAGLSGKTERPPRLTGPNQTISKTNTSDLIGIVKKKKASDSNSSSADSGSAQAGEKKSKEPAVEILPEGVTEILHPKVHGPFIGEVEDGITQTGLISNLFAAPMFCHDPEPSDFLMILGKKPNKQRNDYGPQSLGVVLRPLPGKIFCVGQIEPRVKVFAPNTTGEKNFAVPFVTYQIAKALSRAELKEGRGLRFDEINESLFANTVLLPNALRQRIKQVASYDKNTQIWTTKAVGFEGYPGVESLGRRFSPEGVCAHETACSSVRRLADLGIESLHSGSNSVASVGAAMVYLNGTVNAARERKSKVGKMAEIAKTGRSKTKSRQIALYQKSSSKLESMWKELKRKQEVARFIYEEVQLAPWHLTAEFIDVHKHVQGTGMMKLTGLGDPSGQGEAYNFLREVDAKPNKGTGNSDGALNAQIKKITGTENDLRKLTMKQMASLLRSYGMGQKEIDTLKRWDRVHVIRDLSTKAASDGMGDGLERYARGEKMKLSDQKQMYRERIQEIWRRQRAALSTDAGSFEAVARGGGGGSGSVPTPNGGVDGDDAAAMMERQLENEMDDSDSDSDDDELEKIFSEEFMDVRQTNQLVAQQIRGDDDDDDGGDLEGAVGGLGLQRREDTQEMSKDARELAALKRQREEERAAQEGLLSKGGNEGANSAGKKGDPNAGRKVIRKRVTKTYPDGTQTTTFKFIVQPKELEKAIAAKKKREEKEAKAELKSKKAAAKKNAKPGGKSKDENLQADGERKIVGHSLFEEDEEDERPRSRPGIKLQVQTHTRVIKTKTKKKVSNPPPKSSSSSSSSMPPKPKNAPKLQVGKLKQKALQEKRMKKRKREAEEADLYMTAPQRKGTSNRRERGSARERMPHVIFSDQLEGIRLEVEKRPGSGPFHRPVNRRAIPRYYEVISNPIDLQTIRDKNQRYEYKTVEAFLRDFDLMKNNAIKFNGVNSLLGNEATAIYEFVKNKTEQRKSEFDAMEEAVRVQMSAHGRKKTKTSSAMKSSSSEGSKSPKQQQTPPSQKQQSEKNKSSTSTTESVVLDGIETSVNIGDLSSNFAFGAGADSDSDESMTALMGV